MARSMPDNPKYLGYIKGETSKMSRLIQELLMLAQVELLGRSKEEAFRRSMEMLEMTGLADKAEVRNTDTLSYLSGTAQRFDIAFLDPPYKTGLLQSALEILPKVMNESGVIICEHPFDEELPEETGDFIIKKNYKYGKIMITVYSHKEVDGI